MDEVLHEALEPILRDLRAAGLDEPRIEERDWAGDPERPSAMLWTRDGSASGVSVLRSATAAERVVAVTDQVQEWAIEGQLWGEGPTNWPRCPHHPGNHPMQAATVNDSAVWVCPATDEVVALVGGL